MKTIFSTTILMLLCVLLANSQKLPFQGVARDTSGILIPNQAMSVRISIHDSIPADTVVYKETQSVTTNNLGLFTLNIGAGTVVSGTFSGIQWGSGPKYIQIEIDPTGGTSYINLGTSQLNSVPYALYAFNGGGGSGSWNVTDTTVVQTDTTKYVGIGTTTPQYNLHVLGTVALQTPNETGGNSLQIDQTTAMLAGQNASTGITNVFCTNGPEGSSFPGGSLGALGLDNNGVRYGFWAISDSVQFISADASGNDGIVGSKDSTVFMDVSYNAGGSLNSLTIDKEGLHWQYNNADQYTLPLTDGSTGQVMATNGSGVLSWASPGDQAHFVFTPTSGATITAIVGNNIINPSTGLAILNITLPSSPANNQTVYFTFTNTITAVYFSGGTVVGAMSTVSSVSNGSVHYQLTYDSGTSSWY